MTKSTRQPIEHLKHLQNQIRLIDSVSQAGFSQIRAVATVAMRSLETVDGAIDAEALAGVLACIIDKADECENAINAEAESVGCNHVDGSIARRVVARAATRRQEASQLRELGA